MGLVCGRQFRDGGFLSAIDYPSKLEMGIE